MSILALLSTLIGATVTIIDGIIDCCIQLTNHKLNIRDCCSDTKKEKGMGELEIVAVTQKKRRGCCSDTKKEKGMGECSFVIM